MTTLHPMTLPGFLNTSTEKFRQNIFLWENSGNGYQGITYGELKTSVYQLAAGLISLGVEKGDRVALLSESRNLWVISEFAMLFAGAVNVPLSVRMNDPEEIRFRVAHSGATFMMVSGGQLPRIRDIRKNMPGVRWVIVLDDPPMVMPDEITAGELIRLGEGLLATQPGIVEQRAAAVLPDDYANISYTSGTTSDPKGIILTHRNFMTNVRQAYSLMDITPDFVTLLILPWDHAFAHTAGIFCFMGKGASIAAVQAGKTMFETLRNLPGNLRQIRPHLLYSVPAIAVNFQKNILKGIADKGRMVKWLFERGLRISYLYNGFGCDKGKGWRGWLFPLVKLFDLIICSKIRESFGGRLQFFIGGGALLDLDIQRFFYAIGMPMLQGYGLTEAAPLISANAMHRHKLGSSGVVVKELEIKICDEDGQPLPAGQTGEIVVKGENVMAGYWNNPEATSGTLREGWLHTGDMGYLDPDGFLYVLGRFKSLLIGDDGEKYSPEGMEDAIVSNSCCILNCLLYNNQDPYTIALVFPDREKILQILKHQQLDPASEAGLTAALSLVEQELHAYKSGRKFGHLFPQRWLPAAIGILPEGFTEENHMLNFQLKTVRGKVTDHYHELIGFLYSPAGKPIDNPENRKTMHKLLSVDVA